MKIERNKILVWFRLLLCYVLVAFAGAIGMGIIAPKVFGIDLSRPSDLSGESKLLMVFVGTLLATAVIFLVRKLIDRKTVASLGLIDTTRGKDLLTGFGLGVFTPLVVFILLLLFGGYRIDGYALSVSFVIMALLVACLVAWLEELEFRAYTIENLKIFGYWLPIIVSSIIFVIPHYSGRGFANPAEYISIFIFGMLTGLAYLKNGSIYIPLGFHIGFNFLSDLLLNGHGIIKGEILFSGLQTEILYWIAFGFSMLFMINVLKRVENEISNNRKGDV